MTAPPEPADPQHTYATGGTYTVGLTVTDDDGDTDSTTRDVTITDVYASDAFERVVSNGLGTADSGGPWTISGTASAFSVGSGTGRIGGGLAANRAAYLNNVTEANVDVTTDLALDTAASGSGAYVSVIGRRVSNGNDYRLVVRYVAGGSVQASLARTVGGTQTILATTTVPGLTVTAGEVLRARFVVSGTDPATLTAKVWRASERGTGVVALEQHEPRTPAVLQAPGGVGVLLYTSGSWTGALPAITIDNLAVAPTD